MNLQQYNHTQVLYMSLNTHKSLTCSRFQMVLFTPQPSELRLVFANFYVDIGFCYEREDVLIWLLF